MIAFFILKVFTIGKYKNNEMVIKEIIKQSSSFLSSRSRKMDVESKIPYFLCIRRDTTNISFLLYLYPMRGSAIFAKKEQNYCFIANGRRKNRQSFPQIALYMIQLLQINMN